MSLFLGNLSQHIRQDELERVFRRFGRNNIRLKGGYGFVVYDLPENAEKALRALRGKRICGEAIVLSWSKKQPRPVQRFTKASKFYEPYHRREISRNEDYGMKKPVKDRLEFKMDTNHPVSESQPPYMRELHKKEKNYPVDQIGLCEGGNHNSREGVLDETVAVESNPLDNDRWGEPVSNLLEDNAVEKGRKGTDFNHYEPYHGYSIIDEDGNQTSSHGSPALRNGEEKEWRVQQAYDATSKLPDISKVQQVCYICGLTGHKMCDCHYREASRRDKFTQLDGTDHGRHRHLTFRGRGERELKRPRPASLGKPPSKEDLPSSRLHKSGRKESGKPRTIDHGKNSSMEKETRQHHLKRDHKKKTSKGEQGIQERYRGQQISKGPSSLSSHSVATASSSSSHSKPQGTNSCSRSRSISSQIRLVTSSLKSSPTSYSRSENSKSIQPQMPKKGLLSGLSPLTKPTDESRSSPPTSLSCSIPLDQPLPSSPTKTQVEATLSSQKGYLDSNFETDGLKGTSMTMKDEGMLQSYKAEDEMNKNQTYPQNKEDVNDSTTRFHCEVKSQCMNPSENCTTAADNLPAENSIERSNLEKSEQLTVQQISAASRIENSTNISTQEMYMVLKHYGLGVPEENEMHLTVENYFGSARMWPWQIIYYRRLKKGSILTENYARRIDQNKEFGIVDKYIRSSSGWGEP